MPGIQEAVSSTFSDVVGNALRGSKWLRPIVNRVYISPNGNGIGIRSDRGDYIDTLSCGHEVKRPATGPYKRVRYAVCEYCKYGE